MSRTHLVRLAVSLNRHARLKSAMLVVLIAAAVLIFMLVSELSRASSASLNDAVSRDLGRTGTYRVAISNRLGLAESELYTAIVRGLAATATAPVGMYAAYGSTTSECAPRQETETRAVVVALTALDTSAVVDTWASSTTQCLWGQELPAGVIKSPSETLKQQIGDAWLLPARYGRLARLVGETRGLTMVVTTGRTADEALAIALKVAQVLGPAAARNGVDARTAFTVTRVDVGSNVREASAAVSSVYLLIGWGVLAISGLGLLVVETIVVRDRSWLFGLARALGARRRHVAMLVILDALQVLAMGLVLAVAIAAASSSAVAGFARSAMQIDVALLRPGTVVQLGLGSLAVMVIACAYPVWRAISTDPSDVLEQR